MLGFLIPAFDDAGAVRIDAFAFQVVINHLIGDAQRHFILQAWTIIFQIGSRFLQVEMLRAAKVFQQLLALTLVQAEQGIDVRAAIAILGEETGHGFSRVIGADHYAFGHAGDAVLRFHPLAGFFIAADKIGKRNTRLFQRALTGQHRLFDVYHQRTVGFDKGQRVLTILLIRLHTIGETHGNKSVVVITTLLTQLGDRPLRQRARQG